jgi:predicted double-glycine peptidase
MKRLTEITIKQIKENPELQMNLALAMGVGQVAIITSVTYNRGRSIAKSYEGIKLLEERLGKSYEDLTEELDQE